MPGLNYYNESDRFAADWLRRLIDAELIPRGDVDERSIEEVESGDLRGYTQCHFFAGIGGWPLALQLAGIPSDVPLWTGSCPCQPLSSAGKRQGEQDERHLWPIWYRLIRDAKPAIILGEQVASVDGREWFDGIRLDLDDLGFAVCGATIPGRSVGAFHYRLRIFWGAFDTDPNGLRWQGELQKTTGTWSKQQFEGLLQDQIRLAVPSGRFGALSDGVSGRVGKLRGFGNAIIPQVAAVFIREAMGAIQCQK